MKIVICGSMKLSKRMIEVAKELETLGHSFILPRHTEEYAKLNSSDHAHNESIKNKVNHDLIRKYYDEIKNCDAILVLNENLNSIKNYVGGNSLMEMGFAHVLNKKIFLLNPVPEDLSYSDEIKAMYDEVINGNLSKIK